MSISELPCLGSVQEFLPLVEIARYSAISRDWNFASSLCPLSCIDTVGVCISAQRLLRMIANSKGTLVILRVSLQECEIENFLIQFSPLIPQMPLLKQFALLAAFPDGSVRLNLDPLSQIDRFSVFSYQPGLESLVIGCDALIVKNLIYSTCTTLRSLAFLRGPGSLFHSQEQLTDFLANDLCIEQVKFLHLGTCDLEMDMDPVIALLLARANCLQYVQWSSAGASIDMMKSLMQSGRMQCAFEGVGFLSLLLGL